MRVWRLCPEHLGTDTVTLTSPAEVAAEVETMTDDASTGDVLVFRITALEMDEDTLNALPEFDGW
jgi:hypothetical protein